MCGSGRSWVVLVLLLTPVISGAWRDDRRDPREPLEPREPRELRDMRRSGVHYHSKRHMIGSESEQKSKRANRTTLTPNQYRKKPSGHLTPLLEDDIENDEVISVAIGPPPMRPKYEKHRKSTNKQSSPKTIINNPTPNSTAVDLVKQVLTQLGRELLTKDLNENFVFGQYVGNAMKNLTSDLRLQMQHDVLDLIVKYQKLNNNDTKKEEIADQSRTENKIPKTEKKFLNANETDEAWPDFTNLAKLVG